MSLLRAALPLVFAWTCIPAVAICQESVFLEELTWTEVRDAIEAGKTTVIIPTGGTEQNGPHMVLGKHNYVVKATAGEIARRLGHALVAPVLGYVPEGGGHMRMPGTINLPQEHFEKVLEFAARSFSPHGFLDIVLLGDSGGNQAGLAAVAELLNDEWASTPVRVHHLSDYYGSPARFEWLEAQGESQEDIGAHGGIPGTSVLMYVFPEGIRMDKRARGAPGDGSGVNGDPTRASAEYGRALFQIKVDEGVRQFNELRESSRGGAQ